MATSITWKLVQRPQWKHQGSWCGSTLVLQPIPARHLPAAAIRSWRPSCMDCICWHSSRMTRLKMNSRRGFMTGHIHLLQFLGLSLCQILHEATGPTVTDDDCMSWWTSSRYIPVDRGQNSTEISIKSQCSTNPSISPGKRQYSRCHKVLEPPYTRQTMVGHLIQMITSGLRGILQVRIWPYWSKPALQRALLCCEVIRQRQ